MTNVYIDNLPAEVAQKLFNTFADMKYLSNAECNLSGHNSSVRMESYGTEIFADLEGFFYNEPR